MKQRLRVIQVVNVRWFNATAWYGLALSRLLKDAGHETLVLALPDTEPFFRAKLLGFDPVPLDINTVNPCILAGNVRAVHRLLQDFRPHVVNCHRGEGMLFWAMCRALGHDFVLVRTRGDQRPPRANLFNRWLHAGCADALIATNTDTAEQCRRRLRMPEERLHVIVGGADRERFSPNPGDRAAVRASLGFSPDAVVIGLVGRFDAVKGQRDLVEAFARVLDRAEKENSGLGGRLRLLLMGLPAAFSEGDMRALVKEYGLEGRSVITGRVERPSACINAMDLGVVASRGSEAIARAALEIMACGVPLIGTRVGVMPDLLPAWALVPPNNPPALAELLHQAVSGPVFCERLQEVARERMKDFSESVFLERTMLVYREALQRRFP
jgi:glycosyltransferase involved in cell wall biosynthesis